MPHVPEIILAGYGEVTSGQVFIGQSNSLGIWRTPPSGGFFFIPEGKTKPAIWAKSLKGFYVGLSDWHADTEKNAARTRR